MALKNLLIAYNGGEASDSALQFALQMANKYDAHLTGIVAHSASSVTKNIPKWLTASMRESIGEITANRMTELADRFRQIVAGQMDSNKLHWIDVRADPDKAVSFYSRFFDLTILGQYENLIDADEMKLHPDRITYESGRPILVAPKSKEPIQINDHAVVAWDGRRMASRAFFDAMLVLETKRKVSIVTVGSEGSIPTSDAVDLPTVLARHGVEAEHHYITNKGNTADTLLRHCNDVGAGLLVMGAYEHSKLSEDLFGGVTSRIIQQTNIPLFLSH